MKSVNYKLASFFLSTLLLVGCKKYIEVTAPPTSINAGNVFTNDATAISVLTGIYAKMSNVSLPAGGIASMSLIPALSADELSLYNPTNQLTPFYNAYYSNSLNNLNTGSVDFWNSIYPLIYIANSAIEGLNASTGLTPAVKQQLLGEAKFIRAFCYFYLVNLYGDVALALTSDYQINKLLPRSPKAQVYQQIIADLKDAQILLSAVYVGGDVLTPTTERTSPNKWAATALLARVYLYTKDFPNAERQSSAVISNTALYRTVGIDTVFKKNSNEAIWQLQPVFSTTTTTNTWDAWLFVLPLAGPNITNTYPVYLSTNIVNNFETGDKRKIGWTGTVTVGTTYYYPYKYKVNTPGAAVSEYNTVLRLAEQYLIRAEARTQQDDLSGAVADINVIRLRAGLLAIPMASKTSLLLTIMNERQVELFTEWGHRWLDLKRTNTVDSVMNIVAPQKGGSWNPNWQYYPIQLSQLQADPNLLQNNGY